MPDRHLTCSDDEYEAWLATRPPHVAKLARRFKPGTRIVTHKGPVFVVGYAQEKDGSVAVLLTSETDPFEDYDKAIETRQCICSCCGPSERLDG